LISDANPMSYECQKHEIVLSLYTWLSIGKYSKFICKIKQNNFSQKQFDDDYLLINTG
jgi:hypothetical protein